MVEKETIKPGFFNTIPHCAVGFYTKPLLYSFQANLSYGGNTPFFFLIFTSMRLIKSKLIKPGLLSWILILTVHAAYTQHAHHRHYEFIPNQGQEQHSVNYSVKLAVGKLFVEDKSLLYHLQDNSDITKVHTGKQVTDPTIKGHAYRMVWVNAQKPEYSQKKQTSHYYNYFLGNNAAKWKGGVHAYNAITLHELYPGIAVEFETNHNEQLEFTYKISPGASPMQVMQRYEGLDGIKVSKNGDLVLNTHVGDVKELKPIAWQTINGKKVPVNCRYKITGQNTVIYDFPSGYNQAYELVIDPVLVFGSFSGSSADNFGMTATYDNDGHLYSGGTAFNIGYPTTAGAYDITCNSTLGGAGAGYGITDVVLTKYKPDGTGLVYSTYLGGGGPTSGTETVHSLIVNDNDELMCFGATSSTDFPVTSGAYQLAHAGGSTIQFYYNGVYFQPTGTDIYVTKFNAAGTALIGSTYIGGSGNDGVNYKLTSGTYSTPAAYDSLTTNYGDQFRGEIMLDRFNNIYVVSTTRSTNFPVVNAYQGVNGGAQDAVVFKFNPNLTSLMFSTYLGGSNNDAGYSVKLDASNNIFVTGGTSSANFPVTGGSVYPTYQGGKTDGFISKLSPAGTSLLASSFIGTNVYDQSIFVEVDKNDMVYLYGNTLGTGSFPVINASYVDANSGQFIMRLDNNLTTLDFSTLFGNGGGTLNISPSAFLVDVCGNIYISGWGSSILGGTPPLSGMPVTADAFQGTPGDGHNFYIACFQRNMSGLLYASYFGGGLSQEHVDGGTSRFDKYGIVYQSVCAGCGNHDDFPTTPGAWSSTNNSTNCNNGVFKFDFEIAPVADFTTDVYEGCLPLTITFTNSSPPGLDYLWDFGNGDTSSVIFNPVITYTDTGTYTVTLITEDSICGLIDTAVSIISVYNQLQVSSPSDTLLCQGTILDLLANASGSGSSFVWSTNSAFSDTLNAPITDSSLNVNISSDTVFYVQVFNAGCHETDTVVIDLENLDPIITSAVTSCEGDSALVTAVNATPGEIYTIDWSPDADILSGDGTPNILVSPPDTVLYTVTFTSANCTASADHEVYLIPGGIGGVTAHADNDTIVVGGSTGLHVVPPTGFTYSWFPPTGLSDPNIPNPIATPAVTTTYIVTITAGGCVRRDTVKIVVMDFACEDPYIFLPNAFTPNGDGINDVLYLRGNNITEAYFAVFERWGAKVFETNDMAIGWDGKVNGRDADPAVFDYYLKVTCLGGQEFFQKGNITLIR